MPLVSCAPKFLNGVDGRGFLPLCQRDVSLHRPYGLFHSKTSVLGAAYAVTTISRSNLRRVGNFAHRWLISDSHALRGNQNKGIKSYEERKNKTKKIKGGNISSLFGISHCPHNFYKFNAKLCAYSVVTIKCILYIGIKRL